LHRRVAGDTVFMHLFLIRRLLAAVPVVVVVTVFVFALLHLAPGDPAAIIAGDLASPEDVAKIRAKLGLDQPLLIQFVTWIGQLLRGDLGNSIFSAHPVSELIAQRLEPTLSLTLMTLFISVLLAVPLGVIAAWRAGSWIDRGVMAFAVFGFSVPGFVIGYVLIWLFAIELGWLPVQGYTPLAKGLWPWLSNILLPSFTLALAYMALIARITRASMLETLSQDYIRTAHAKGLATENVLMGTRLAQRCGPDRDRDRHRRRAPDRRRRRHRERIRDPGSRPADGRRDPAPRLSGDPGHHPCVLGRVRRGQPRGRHALHRARSAHQVLG
jgi:peptide/nickel transport system permease protein